MKLLPVAAVFLGLAVSGCLGAGTTQTKEATVYDACQTWYTALDNAAIARTKGQINDTQADRINDLRPLVNKICIDGEYINVEFAKEDLRSYLRELATMGTN